MDSGRAECLLQGAKKEAEDYFIKEAAKMKWQKLSYELSLESAQKLFEDLQASVEGLANQLKDEK